MKKRLYSMICLCCFVLILLFACGKNADLIDLSTVEGDEYMSIVWEDRTYIPFCVVSKNDCGIQIGYLDGETDNRVCEYKDYATDEWIASYLTVDGGAMLYKEVNVTDIPDGLTSEYEWNSPEIVKLRAKYPEYFALGTFKGLDLDDEQLPEQEEADAMYDRIPMVRVNGKLYYDTGKESTVEGRCGNMDGEITSTVDGTEIPTEDNQSNFGSGFGYQYGADDTIEIYRNEKWVVFEYREESE